MTTTTNYGPQKIIKRLYDRITPELQKLSDLQNSYRELMGENDPRIQEKVDAIIDTHSQKVDLLMSKYSAFQRMMNIPEAQLLIESSNQRLDLAEEPEGLEDAIRTRSATSDQYWGGVFPRAVGKSTKNYERIYGMFESPEKVREILLNAQSLEEWKNPQSMENLRKTHVSFDGRDMTLHTLMMMHGVYKFNQGRDRWDFLNLDDVQADHNISHHAASTRKEMGELLDYAGIEHTWKAEIADVPFGEAGYMRHLLNHGEFDGQEISFEDLDALNQTEFRRVHFTDPKNGFSLNAHSMMLFFSAMPYAAEHGMTIPHAAIREQKGKSNSAVRTQIMELVSA